MILEFLFGPLDSFWACNATEILGEALSACTSGPSTIVENDDEFVESLVQPSGPCFRV